MIDPNDASYDTFQRILTGYRLSRVLLTLNECCFFERLDPRGSSAEMLVRDCGWHGEKGLRFLDVLVFMGLLVRDGDLLKPSLFTETYLVEGAKFNQKAVLSFENRLVESWQTLGEVLSRGERSYGAIEKSQEEYERDLALYIDAMDGAAQIRARELWDRVDVGDSGVVADLGAGSGLYLYEFLVRNPGWKGVFCDLRDVIRKTSQEPRFKSLGDRIRYVECNLLGPEDAFDERGSSDLVLMSNLVHCQGGVETGGIISRAAGMLKEDGVVLVHDFFLDRGWFGALYDTHMMLNTYNGRTYKVEDIAGMYAGAGLGHWCLADLPSRSTVVAGSAKNDSLKGLLKSGL